MSEGNYFVVNRKIFDHWLWKDSKEPATRFEAWLYILNRANWKPSKVLIGNDLVQIPRGSFITSQPKLGECFRWGRERIRAFLLLLESDQMITLECTKQYTRISIVNYDTYQISQPTDQATDNPRADSQPAYPSYTENKDKKEKKGKKDKNLNPLTPFQGEPVWPAQIDTPTARAEWNRWLTYKHAKRSVYKTLDSHEAALRRCAKQFQTPERMIAAIEFSISQGWSGIFEEKKNQGGKKPNELSGVVGPNGYEYSEAFLYNMERVKKLREEEDEKSRT